MFMFLVQDGILDEVHLDFMVPGHSFLPCDRGFGTIERACKKKEIINCPSEYATIISKIKNAKVHKLNQNEVLNVKSLKKRITERKATPPFYFHKARTIKISKKNKFKYTIVQAQLGEVTIDLRKKNRPGDLTSERIPLKYPLGLALKVQQKKVDDINHFRPYLNRQGQAWLDEVTLKQQDAQNRPQKDVEETTPEENLQDDDQVEYEDLPAPLQEFDQDAPETEDPDADMFPDEL